MSENTNTERDYPELPNFDSGDEPIWEAILSWKTAQTGADAHRKALAVEAAIISTLRAYVDEDRKARASMPLPAAGQEPVAWTGGEEWEQLAWHLCAEENGEESCGELIWEGGPVPEPWGERWLKYEGEAKRMIELVRKFAAPQPAVAAGWVSVKERLPGWAVRDDTPCFINNEEVPPTLTSETVLVALKGGGVRTDKLTTIEGKSDGWWHTYGERVVAWMPLPPAPSTEGESNG